MGEFGFCGKKGFGGELNLDLFRYFLGYLWTTNWQWDDPSSAATYFAIYCETLVLMAFLFSLPPYVFLFVFIMRFVCVEVFLI